MALFALWLAALGLVRGLRRFLPRGLPYVYRQGLANLYRPANQTLMVVLALGFGAFLLEHAAARAAQPAARPARRPRRARPNLVFFDVQPDQRDDVAARVAAAGPLTAPVVPIVPMRIESLKGRADLGAAGDRGRDAAARALGAAARVPQQLPRRADELRARRGGSLVARRRAGAAPGPRADRGRGRPRARAEARGRRRRGVGRAGSRVDSRVACLREVEWARFEPNFFVVFPEGPLDGAPHSYVLLSRVEDAEARARLQRAVVEAHPNVSTLDLAQVQRSIESVLDKVLLAVRFMALFSLAAGAVVLAGAVAASRYQRVREGALLRTLGAPPAAARPHPARRVRGARNALGARAVLLSGLAGWALVRFVFDGRFALPLFELALLLVSVLALTVAWGLRAAPRSGAGLLSRC